MSEDMTTILATVAAQNSDSVQILSCRLLNRRQTSSQAPKKYFEFYTRPGFSIMPHDIHVGLRSGSRTLVFLLDGVTYSS